MTIGTTPAVDHSRTCCIWGLDMAADIADKVQNNVMFHISLEICPGQEVEVFHYTAC